jgi:hypothetical protein
LKLPEKVAIFKILLLRECFSDSGTSEYILVENFARVESVEDISPNSG